MVGNLFIIATPIGNIQDITTRASLKLKELNVIFAEDTRELKALLNHLQISCTEKKIHSMSFHNLKQATNQALEYLKQGHEIGIVSDRGTPGIADPGALIVKEAHKYNMKITPIPGVSSLSTLLSVSGIEAERILYSGFFPRKEKLQNELMSFCHTNQLVLCFFESPHRIHSTLEKLKGFSPKGRVMIGREMTKKFENYEWYSLSNLETKQIPSKGEFTCLVEWETPEKSLITLDVETLRSLKDTSPKEWVEKVSELSGAPSKQQLKKLFHS